jgi:hypothetical protein
MGVFRSCVDVLSAASDNIKRVFWKVLENPALRSRCAAETTTVCQFRRVLPLSRLKHEKAKRLVRYNRILRESPTAAPLTCDCIVDDDELDEAVD